MLNTPAMCAALRATTEGSKWARAGGRPGWGPEKQAPRWGVGGLVPSPNNLSAPWVKGVVSRAPHSPAQCLAPPRNSRKKECWLNERPWNAAGSLGCGVGLLSKDKAERGLFPSGCAGHECARQRGMGLSRTDSEPVGAWRRGDGAQTGLKKEKWDLTRASRYPLSTLGPLWEEGGCC